MNQHEREICARFKLIRETLKMPERNFAKILFVTRDQVAGVEYGRSPLRFGIASSLSRATGCNLHWLAEGTGPMKGSPPNPDIMALISPRSLFSAAWKTTLKKALKPGEKFFGPSWDGMDESLSVGGASALEYSQEEITGYFKNLPPEFHWKFFDQITKACRDFEQMNRAKIIQLNACASSGKNNDLTDAATYKKLKADMKKQLPSLLERLNQATKETGKMSALADYLKVPLASVSRWLSGKREPGGETTLKMLQWVEQQERQK